MSHYEKLRIEIRGHLKFAVAAWLTTLPILWASFAWAKANEFLRPTVSWLHVFLYPTILVLFAGGLMVGGMWFVSRSSLRHAQERDEAEAVNDGTQGATTSL